MKYIDTFREGMHIADVYLCKNKQIAMTKNGKEYGNLVLQDKTGTIDAKIWDLGSPGNADILDVYRVCVPFKVTLRPWIMCMWKRTSRCSRIPTR